MLLNKTTVTRPDGSTVDASGSATSSGSEQSVRQKRQLGPTTMSFHFINQRHAVVNDLKQKYGNAVRIVHRGKKSTWDALLGSRTVYTLIFEVPAKCTKCKE